MTIFLGQGVTNDMYCNATVLKVKTSKTSIGGICLKVFVEFTSLIPRK